MRRVWLAAVVVLAFGVTVFVAPHGANADVKNISIRGDCTHVDLTITFSGANGAYQNTLISAETANGGLAGKFVDVPASDTVSTSLSWSEVPRGTRITIYADHYIQGQGLVDFTSKSYVCGEPVSSAPVVVFAPETEDRVVITANMPVYSGTNLGQAVPGSQVEVGQEFLMVDSVVVDDVTWYQIFIGGAYPWVPDLGAYAYSN